MQNKEQQKKICRKCGGIGHLMVYEAHYVKRKYCDCETGKKQKEFVEEQVKIKDIEPVWELLTI